jgi:transcriptional regulator GlxA family with amidase domain
VQQGAAVVDPVVGAGGLKSAARVALLGVAARLPKTEAARAARQDGVGRVPEPVDVVVVVGADAADALVVEAALFADVAADARRDAAVVGPVVGKAVLAQMGRETAVGAHWRSLLQAPPIGIE